MKILITGVCGFVGGILARGLIEALPGIQVSGVDNLIRPGSEQNRGAMMALGVKVRHADVRSASDFESLPAVDWVIDAAANPSVMAGVDGLTSSRQLIEHNLYGTVNMLEFCKRCGAGFILLSTSRVYSIGVLASLPMSFSGGAFGLCDDAVLPVGVSQKGIAEAFSTAPPVSLYGCAKLSSELLALEYGDTFGFPVWINRCGVMAGAGQFGRSDQGIFAFWIHSWFQGRPLTYIGFRGKGGQLRDCLHPRDLVPLLVRQMETGTKSGPQIYNLGGGMDRAMSLAQLSTWCEQRFGPRDIRSDDRTRPFDVPWMVMDSKRAEQSWGWIPATPMSAILDEIAQHAEAHSGWLELSTGG